MNIKELIKKYRFHFNNPNFENLTNQCKLHLIIKLSCVNEEFKKKCYNKRKYEIQQKYIEQNKDKVNERMRKVNKLYYERKKQNSLENNLILL